MTGIIPTLPAKGNRGDNTTGELLRRPTPYDSDTVLNNPFFFFTILLPASLRVFFFISTVFGLSSVVTNLDDGVDGDDWDDGVIVDVNKSDSERMFLKPLSCMVLLLLCL